MRSLETHSIMGLTAIRLYSALIFTVTAKSEGLFAPLEGCLCFHGEVIIVLHSYSAQYFTPSIVYIFSFPVKTPLWQSLMHRNVNKDGFSILWLQLRVLFPPLGMLVAMLDGCTVGTTWELLSLLGDVWGLSSTCGVWCQSNNRCCQCASPRVIHLVSRLLIDELPGGCVRWRLGCFVLVNQQNKLNQEIAGTGVYIFLLPACSSILFASQIQHIISILNSLDITWLAQNNPSRSETHPMTYSTLGVPCGFRAATCNCIIMLMPPMWVHLQLTPKALKGSHKEKGKATFRAKMPTSVRNWRHSLDRDRIEGVILEHIHGLIPIYNVCGVNNERAWDLFHDIIFLDPVKTRHISQFQLMSPHRRSRCSPCQEWLAAFRSYMGHMLGKTRD